MDSNSFLNYQHHQRHPNSGLLRFRSAPTSLLNDFTQSLSSDLSKANNPWEGPESDKLVSRFVSAHELDSSAFPEFEAKAPNKVLTDPMNLCNNNNNNNGLPPHYPRQNSTSSSAMDSSYRLVEPLGMDPQTPVKTFNTNLLRQSSSPAGLFSNTSFPNGYSTVKGVFNYGGGVNGSNGGGSPSMSRLKNQHGMLSRSNSSLGVLSQISEVEGESTEATNPDNGCLPSVNGYVPAFPYNTSWNDASHLSESLGGLKREPSNSEHLFSIAQNGALGNRVHMLSHHLSLPKPMADMGAMEKFLQFPDSVPCKIRAKRGCATHPRSIAERVRRTRISERMRKLQELVPNMDKQTNTSDMLDLAVEYIKDLQNQFKILNEKRAKCKCMSTQ